MANVAPSQRPQKTPPFGPSPAERASPKGGHPSPSPDPWVSHQRLRAIAAGCSDCLGARPRRGERAEKPISAPHKEVGEPSPGSKPNLDQDYARMQSPDTSDEETVSGISRFEQYAMTDVDAGIQVVNYLGTLTLAKPTLDIQEATAKALIKIMQHARPPSKTGEVGVLSGYPPSYPKVDVIVKRKVFRGYYEPARLAVIKLGQLFKRVDDDRLREEITAALDATASEDTSKEIYLGARDTLEEILPGSAEGVDCDRLARNKKRVQENQEPLYVAQPPDFERRCRFE